MICSSHYRYNFDQTSLLVTQCRVNISIRYSRPTQYKKNRFTRNNNEGNLSYVQIRYGAMMQHLSIPNDKGWLCQLIKYQKHSPWYHDVNYTCTGMIIGSPPTYNIAIRVCLLHDLFFGKLTKFTFTCIIVFKTNQICIYYQQNNDF